jgi:hypothetical protein
MKNIFFTLLLISLLSLSSCFTTGYTYSGNVFQKCIGMSKNEIVRTYGAPDRILDDGAGGSILVYEQLSQTTISAANGASYGRSSTVGAAVYGNGGIIGASETRAGQVSSMNGISHTIINKRFLNMFINSQNTVYDFKSNYGALYNTSRCYDRKTTTMWVVMGAIFFSPSLIVTIPLTNSKRHKAERNGEICN